MEKPLLLLSVGQKKAAPRLSEKMEKQVTKSQGSWVPRPSLGFCLSGSCLLSGRPLGSWLTQSSVILRGSKAFRLSHHQSLTVGRWCACVYFLVVLGTSDAPAWAGARTRRFAHISA